MNIDMSEESLYKTHYKTIEVCEGFMFHDLQGNPMWIEKFPLIHWKPRPPVTTIEEIKSAMAAGYLLPKSHSTEENNMQA